jgi:6-pyruvoyltetrahydropterin/6-carboxytetrahydropterin synthase
MFEIIAESMFSAAHHLLNYEGKCENQHGHNWKVKVSVRGNKLDKSNILVDFKFLKHSLNNVLDLIDHKDLNELSYFADESPSSEMIAKFIFEELSKEINNIYYVAVWETPTSCAKYYGEEK